MTLFTDTTKMQCKTLSRYNNYNFFSGAYWYTLFGIKAQFIIRKEEPTVLVRWASYDKKPLARQVILLALRYRTALSSCPAFTKMNSM